MAGNPTEGLVIRTYQPSDQPGFEALVRDVHDEFGLGYDRRLDADLSCPEDHYRHVFVLAKGDRVCGTAALRAPDAGVVTLKRMYVTRSLRGGGWGGRLLETCLLVARQDGCTAVTLDTMERQGAAQRMYESAGFQMIRRARGVRFYRLSLLPS